MKQNIIRNFESLIRIDSSAYGLQQKKDIASMLKYLPAQSKLLDAGCGFGLPTAQAAEFYDTCACDILKSVAGSASFRELLMSLRGIDFRWSEPTKLPYDDQVFDGILLYAVIEHVPNSEKVAFLKECRRVLKPAGKLFMFRAVNSRSIAERLEHKFGYMTHGGDVVSLTQMRQVTGESGFHIVKWGYQGWLPENHLPRIPIYAMNAVLARIPLINLFSHDFYFICTKA